MDRRSFLLGLSAALPQLQAGTSYNVGLANGTDPYSTTRRAIQASCEFPNVAGKDVGIKVNLVLGQPSTTGATTDPQVVRAIVDECLSQGAAAVHIGELGGVSDNGTKPPPFGLCGYDIFTGYDPRVTLEDWGARAPVLLPVPNGLVYQQMYLPVCTQSTNRVWITAAKMKVHNLTGVTLGVKNSFGFFSPKAYNTGQPGVLPRTDPHLRGLDQSLVDVHLARPMHYCVIDGIWGMQGYGPYQGTPIAANVVLAGANVVAVDRVAMKVMALPQKNFAMHLDFAAYKGLGPADLSSVNILGDPLQVVPFLAPQLYVPATLWPTPTPNLLSSTNGKTTIYFHTPTSCHYRMEVICDPDATPGVSVLRTLFDWTYYPASSNSRNVAWDGRNEFGALLPAGPYMVRLISRFDLNETRTMHWSVASNYLTVTS